VKHKNNFTQTQVCFRCLGLFFMGVACYCRALNTERWVTFIAINNMDRRKEMEIPASYILFLVARVFIILHRGKGGNTVEMDDKWLQYTHFNRRANRKQQILYTGCC